MVLKRRWGIIGSIALAQIAIVVALQFTLSGSTLGVSAQADGQQPETVRVQNVPRISQVNLQQPSRAPLRPELDTAVMPPIPVPVMPGPPQAAPEILPTAFAEVNPLLEVAQETKGNSIPLPVGQMPPSEFSGKYHDQPMPLPDIPGHPGQPFQAKKIEEKPVETCPWNLKVEVVKGRTHVTAQNGQELMFTISCDKLDVQTPAGFIVAMGNVKVATDNIEGDCDRLTISWRDEVVVLQKAQLKCKLQGHEAAFHADQLTVRLSPVAAIPVPDMPPPQTPSANKD